jgi:hypothetical protein
LPVVLTLATLTNTSLLELRNRIYTFAIEDASTYPDWEELIALHRVKDNDEQTTLAVAET